MVIKIIQIISILKSNISNESFLPILIGLHHNDCEKPAFGSIVLGLYY